MSGPVQPPLTVETVDGATVGRPITKIKVTNGDLTISGNVATIDTSGGGGAGTVTSVGLTETGTALTITGTNPVTTSGTINIAGAGTSSQVILGNLTLATLPTGTIAGSSTVNQISFGDTTANEITSSSNLQFLSGQNLYVAGQIKIGNATGTKLTTVSAQNLILDTDDGSNSGNITIEAGTNGQISITPDGTGLVKIDGVGINNSAIATNYILKATSATEAGWVAESAGGGFTGSLADTQVAFGNTTADSIQGSSNFTFGSNILKIGDASGSATFTSGGTGFTKIGVNNGSSGEPFIFLSSGSSGNLQLNAGGTGTASPLGVVQVGQTNMGVEISRAYTLPKVVTAANDYVLTAQTDGTTAWAASGGGVTFPLEGSDGSAVAPTYSFSSASNLGFFKDGSTAVSFTSGGTRQMSFDANGVIRLGGSASKLSTYTNNLVLDTDLGTNSGSIVIEAGVDGQISITPNGAGTIKLDGVELDNSAIATGYVLKATSATEAGWAAESGGGGGASGSMIYGSPNGDWGTGGTVIQNITSNGWSSSQASTTTDLSTGYQLCRPFVSSMGADVTKMSLRVTTASAGSNIRVGIYNADSGDGNPTSLIGYGEFDSSSTGTKTVTSFSSTITLVRGSPYWFVVVATSGSPAVSSMNATYANALYLSNGYQATAWCMVDQTNTNVLSDPLSVSTMYGDNGSYAPIYVGIGFL